MTRQRLATHGDRGELVRFFRDTKRKKYTVQWTEQGARRQRSFPLTAKGKQEAEAFAKAFTATRVATIRTTRALWDRYKAAEFGLLRPNSQRLYTAAWTLWEAFYGVSRDPSAMTLEECGAFARWLAAEKGHGVNTIRGSLRVVRRVYTWGEAHELISRNRWHAYTFRVPTGQEPPPRAEYRADEFLRLWRELDATKPTQWRASVTLGLLGIYGNRQHAALALEWAWVGDDAITIPPQVEKTGKTAVLPMLPLTRHILDVAKGWRDRLGYDGPYVLFSGSAKSKQPHYTIQSFWRALLEAETRAGITHVRGRAGHGFRRMLVGDLADATGDVGLALQAIGDSLAMAKHYRVRRDDRIKDALAARLTRMMTEGTPEGATDSATDLENHPRKEG